LAGLVSTLNGFVRADSGFAGSLFLSVALVYFLVGVFIGAKLIFDQTRFRQQSFWFWLIQVPVVNSAYFSFHVTTGAFCALWLRLDVYDAGVAFGIASQFQIELMAGGPVAMGINILALSIVLLIRGVVNAAAEVK
jgi:hypothetical protein